MPYHGEGTGVPHSPVERLDLVAVRLLQEAQDEANRRGHFAVVSGLILLAAANEKDLKQLLLRALGTNETDLQTAVDAEWAEAPAESQDRPPGLVRDAIFRATEASRPGAPASPAQLLAALLTNEDSMASRVVRRLGGDPGIVIRALTDDGGAGLQKPG